MTFLPDIQDLYTPPTDDNVWKWTEKNITLSSRVTPYPGRYKTDWCPYVREPQEKFTDPEVHDIVLCWASRSSKTETALNCIRYSIAKDPQSMIVVMPTELLARSFSETRLQPSIDDCSILASQKPVNLDRYKLTEMHFKRCTLWMVGANSPATLKGRGVTVLLCDEIDTWPQATGKETGALQQVLERTKDRWNRKHILTSTPTIDSGQIWREFLLGDRRYYFVPCPHCGVFQTLKMKQIEWSPEAKKENDVWDLAMVKNTSAYKCESCKGMIQDHHKAAMLSAGEWRATNSNPQPGRVSYHLNSLYPVWISFGEVATMFLQSKQSTEDLQRFVNSWLAEPFYQYGDNAEQESVLLKNQTTEKIEGVPEGNKAIMTIDVQQDRVYFVVRAYARDGVSILLEHGCVPGNEECEVICRKWGVVCSLVDARFRQQQIFEWCATHPGWIPTMGSAGLFQPMRWVTMPIDGGLLKGRVLRTIRFRPDDYKDILFTRIKGGTPAWKLPPNVGEDYKKQMLGEVRHERRGSRGKIIMEWVRRGPNHYWDCEVMQVVAFSSIKEFIFDMPTEVSRKPPELKPAEIERAETLQAAGDQIWQGEHTVPWS